MSEHATGVTVWRIATSGPGWKATDLDGKGAALTGGRWNHKDMPVVYAASSIALACLESVVHFNADGLPIRRALVAIHIPQDVWDRALTTWARDLPPGWDMLPDSWAASEYGSQWLRSDACAVHRLPSVIIPQEFNVLINPRHQDARLITAKEQGPFVFDGRLVR